MRFIDSLDGLIAVAAIVIIEEEDDTPAERAAGWRSRRIHYRYSACETRTTWASLGDVDRLLSDSGGATDD